MLSGLIGIFLISLVLFTAKLAALGAARIVRIKTGRIVYINQAWMRARCVNIHWGVQLTNLQVQSLLEDVFPADWQKEEIEEMEAAAGAYRSSLDIYQSAASHCYYLGG